MDDIIAITGTMEKSHNKSSGSNYDESTAEMQDSGQTHDTSIQQLEVALQSALDNYNAFIDLKIDTLRNQQLMITAESTRAISELSDLVTGLSLEMTQHFAMVGGHKNGPPEKDTEIVVMGSAGKNLGGQKNPIQTQLNQNGYNYTHLAKIEFPRFGGDDVKSWLFRIEQFFLINQVSEDIKLKLAGLHLESKSLQWHQAFLREKKGEVPTWDEYVEAISNRFREAYDDPMAELMNLKQTGSVREYHDCFDAIMTRLELSPKHSLTCLVAGLEEETQLQLRLCSPKSIQQAFCLTELHEAREKVRL